MRHCENIQSPLLVASDKLHLSKGKSTKGSDEWLSNIGEATWNPKSIVISATFG